MGINRDELLFVVDENDNPLQPLPRSEVHAKRLWHRSAHICIVNSTQDILCQQRSKLKDTHPGKWEPHFGGHVLADQNYLQAAVDELKEELGLTVKPQQLTHFKIHKDTGKDNKFESIYLMRWDGELDQLILEVEEIDQVAWRPVAGVRQAYTPPLVSAWASSGYEVEMLDWIERQK